MKTHLLGFDIGGTKCAAVLGNRGGEPVDKIKFPTPPAFPEAWELLAAAGRDLLERGRISQENLIAAGISCGGPLDTQAGLVLSPPNLPDWDRIPITRKVEETFRCPAFLMNDANACALAEWSAGAGKGSRDMVFLTMGTGLGGGIILNGRLCEGASGMAGEFGHIRLRRRGPEGYGKKGSFEGFCGGNGIARRAEALAETYPDRRSVEEYIKFTGSRDFSVRSLARAEAEGNAFARRIFELTGEMLGCGLAVILDGLNPECIVIGSIFERCEPLLRPAMERVLQQEVLPQTLAACRIVPALLGDRIGDYAALTVARHGAGITLSSDPS